MAEYIERDAALEIVKRTSGDYATAFAEIRKIPAADVVPVVHGRWRYCGFLQECQTCGEIYSMHGGNAGKSWNYCPNCGAKMDGGDGDAAD